MAAPAVPMEIEAPARVVKRTLCDVEGVALPDAKRNRAPLDIPMKQRVLATIFHLHELFFLMFRVVRTNIDDVATISSFIMTIHNKLRQELNQKGGLRTLVVDAFEFTHLGVTKKYAEIKEPCLAVMELYGLQYVDDPDFRSMIGTFQALFTLIVAFRSRLNEVRTGMTKIVLRKGAEGIKEVPISQFNLDVMYSVTLKGCTFSPNLQSAMKQSLGPMTIAINLAMTTNKDYDSWKKAFCGAFKNINVAPQIANILAGSKQKWQGIMHSLATLATFGVTRTSNKAHVPAAMFLSYLHIKCPAYKNFFQGLTLETISDEPFDTDDFPSWIKNFDFSGHGLLGFWNE